MPEESALAERLAGFIGDAAVRLGIGAAPEEVSEEVRPLIGDPVDLFDRHPVWPSFLTDLGLPVELSVKLGGPRGAELRCTIDVTDYRGGLERNWSRYLAYATAVAGDKGADEYDLWYLCQRALSGVPAACPSRMMHGVGFGPSGWRRGSVYFRTGWLDAPGLIRRFPAEASALAEAYRTYGSPVAGGVEVIGYDFAPGARLRSKAYAWIFVDEGMTFADAVGTHPDLAPAQLLFEAERTEGAALPERSLALQTSADEDLHQRLVFLSPAWGWAAPDRQEHLLELIERELGIDTSPIERCAEAAAECGFRTSVALVAVGAEDGAPSATFYVWPAPAAQRAGSRTRGTGFEHEATAAIDRGIEYLTGMRADDGWEDYELEGSASRGFVTAFVGGVLSGDGGAAHLVAELQRDEGALRAVLDGQSPAGSWGSPSWADDLVATWQALLALRTYTDEEQTDEDASRATAARSRALLFLRSTAVPVEPLALAAWLGGWLAAGGHLEPRIFRAAHALVALQQPDGRWLAGPSRRIGVDGGTGSYVDNRCLVTTAAAVASLRAMLAVVAPAIAAGVHGSSG